MMKLPVTDVSYLRMRLHTALGVAPDESHKLPAFDFFWSRATARQKPQVIVTFVGKSGYVGVSEDFEESDKFPSEELVTKIRLVLP